MIDIRWDPIEYSFGALPSLNSWISGTTFFRWSKVLELWPWRRLWMRVRWAPSSSLTGARVESEGVREWYTLSFDETSGELRGAHIKMYASLLRLQLEYLFWCNMWQPYFIKITFFGSLVRLNWNCLHCAGRKHSRWQKSKLLVCGFSAFRWCLRHLAPRSKHVTLR